MAAGHGKGKADQVGVIAASCCTICCAVCFFLVGIPMLIGGIVCIRIYEGDYDTQVAEAIADCYVDNGYIYPYDPSQQDEAESKCGSLEAWDDAKDICRIVGIVLIVIFVLATIGGIVMIVLMCTAVCKTQRPQGGMVMAQTNQGYMYQTQPAAAPPQYQDPNAAYPTKPGV